MQPLALEKLDALGRSEDSEFIPEFLHVLNDHLEYREPMEGRDDLAYLVWTGSDDLRVGAVDILKRHREVALSGLLEAVVEHEDNYLRPARAAYFLGELGDERAVQPLTTLAEGGSLAYFRNVGSAALSKIAPLRVERLQSSGDVPQLVEELRNRWGRHPATLALSRLLEDPAAHEAAAQALGRLFDPKVIGFLVHQIRQITHVRDEALAAANVLAEMPEVGPTVPALVNVVRALGVEAPAEFEAALERIGGSDAERAVATHRKRYPPGEARRQVARIINAVEYGTPVGEPEWSLALHELEALGPDAVAMLAAVIEDVRRDDQRYKARDLLSELSRNSPEIQRARDDYDARRPRRGSHAPGLEAFYPWPAGGGEKAHIEAETEAYLKSVAAAREKKVEDAIKERLTTLQQSDDFEMLTAALVSQNKQIREGAVGILRGRGDPRFVEPLVDVLRDSVASDDRRMTDKVTKALKAIGAAGTSGLVPALNDELPTVRWIVANLLGQVGESDAIPALESLLNDPDEFVREAAQVALERIASR